MSTEREYLNILKGFLIVLVVIGHFGQTIANNLPNQMNFIAQGIILFIYVFHMPLFLFVSGFLSKNVEQERSRAFGNLFIPYILFQLLLGISELILTKQGKALQNLFIPQMGVWYLLTLFSYRLILPEIRKVRGILVLAFSLTTFTCLFTEIGNEFALKKTLGFFIYFIAGYMFKEIPKNRLNKIASRLILTVILLMFILISWMTDWYAVALAVLTRGIDANGFDQWYIAPMIYLITFIVTSIICLLVMNALPDKNAFLEKQGKDTMPMYLSHLLLFFAVSFLVPKNNWIIIIIISIISIVFSLIAFYSNGYRNFFNKILYRIKKIVLIEA